MANDAGLLIIFGRMITFAVAITLYDLLARRQHRRERERGKSA